MGDAGDNLKNDFKNMFKHTKKMIRGFFRGRNSGPVRRKPGFWGPPFSPFRSPLVCLFYPKLIVGAFIILTLLLCGVGFYGLIIIILLILLFILI